MRSLIASAEQPDDTLSIGSVTIDELAERTRCELGQRKRKSGVSGEREKPPKKSSKSSTTASSSKEVKSLLFLL